MADELPDINRIGQAAIELPQAVMSTEAEHLTEKMNIFNAKVQELGGIMPLALPPLPTGIEQLAIPPLPGMPAGAGVAEGAPATLPAAEKKVRSYMEL